MKINSLTEEEQQALAWCLATYSEGDPAYTLIHALRRLDSFLINAEARIEDLEDQLQTNAYVQSI